VNGTTTIFVTDADNREVLEYDGASGLAQMPGQHPPRLVLQRARGGLMDYTRGRKANIDGSRWPIWDAITDRCI
jgi:hypothetical protein